jgi:hypothetical protein
VPGDSGDPGVYSELEAVVSISGELKLELMSTWIRYDVAPLTDDQSKYGVVSQVLLPFDGDDREGAAGADEMVKRQGLDQGPVPQEPRLVAFTRQ